MTKSCS